MNEKWIQMHNNQEPGDNEIFCGHVWQISIFEIMLVEIPRSGWSLNCNTSSCYQQRPVTKKWAFFKRTGHRRLLPALVTCSTQISYSILYKLHNQTLRTQLDSNFIIQPHTHLPDATLRTDSVVNTAAAATQFLPLTPTVFMCGTPDRLAVSASGSPTFVHSTLTILFTEFTDTHSTFRCHTFIHTQRRHHAAHAQTRHTHTHMDA